MSKFLDIKNRTLALFEKSYRISMELGCKTSAEKILELGKLLSGKQLMIVTMGEARRGKSSLLNAFLNEKDPLFPVDVNVCTNVVTVVKYGEKESVRAYISGSDGSVTEEELSRSQIGDYVSEKGNPDNYKMVSRLEIAIPNELLKEGIVLVDTPGVGSLNASHAETTYNFLPNADIVLFVSDANSGYTVSELDFMKRSYSFCKNIIFPVTKIDTNANYQTIVEDNRKKIAQTISLPAEKIEIVPVSNMAKLRYLSTGNKAMYRHSNFEALENAVWNMISRTKIDIMIMPYLNDLGAEIESIHSSIATQSALLDQNKNTVNEMIKAYEDELNRIKQYQEDGAEWKTELLNVFQQVGIEINSKTGIISDNATELLENTVNNLDKKICKKENYQKLIMDINELIALGTVDIRNLVAEEISEKISVIRQKLELDIDVNSNVLARIEFTDDSPDKEIEFKKRKKSDAFVNKGGEIGRNMLGGTRAGAVFGAIVGGATGLFVGHPIAGAKLGAALGGAAGSLFGGAKGTAEALTQKYDATDVNTVKREISKHISSSIKKMSGNNSLVMLELKNQLIKAFDKEFRQRMDIIRENAESIKRNISLAGNESSSKKVSYSAQLKKLAELKKLIVELTEEASSAVTEIPSDPSSGSVRADNNSTGGNTTYDFL